MDTRFHMLASPNLSTLAPSVLCMCLMKFGLAPRLHPARAIREQQVGSQPMARVHWAAASQPGQAHGLSYPLAQLSDEVRSLSLPPGLAHCPISKL